MKNIWALNSNKYHIFIVANNYKKAKEQFKVLLKKYTREGSYPIFDEIIEITKLTKDGTPDETYTNIEFTETWLKELDIKIDIYHY